MNRRSPTSRLLAAVCAGALLCAAFAAAAQELQWLPATVELSDGTVLEGGVHVTDGAVIIHNEAQGRRYTVRAAEMARLEQTIERQSMEEKWLFRESGLDDKVYTGQVYPVRHYTTRITFHDGRQLEGHIVAKTLHVKTGDGTQRFILRRKDEGKVGQTLEDLLYVRSVTFQQEGPGVRGTIEGTLHPPEGERLQQVMAVNRDKLFSVEVAFNPFSGEFRAADCTEGTYDLIVVTDKAIYLYFSRERDEGAARMDAAQVTELQAWVDRLREFFHEQRIVYAAGNDQRAFVLVRKERHGGMTLQGAELIRRYDVWAMHKPGEEWQIEKRMFLRRLVSETPTVPRRDVVITPALGGHTLSAQVDSLELEVTLARNSEPPVPPAREPQE
ncbi:MAG: hypothetical protein AMK73_03320 [Planctomycetes bacterium SM23_32]|nr:MAG: hypothetical protein AMK73_03320 [Planctomycetes bacterium SM23_32]